MFRPLCIGVVTAVCCLFFGSAMAQDGSLKDKVIGDPYSQINAFISAWKRIPDTFSGYSFEPGEPHDIKFCAYTDENRKSLDDVFLVNLQIIANHYVSFSKEASEAGYPQQVWHRPLNELMRAQIGEIVKRRKLGKRVTDINALRRVNMPYERRLERSLNEYRNKYKKSLPEFNVAEGPCGGDYIGFVKLKTKPADGVVEVIREYWFKLCQVNNIPPYSKRCDMWSLASPDVEFPQGKYYYSARWSDGNAECNRIELINKSASTDRAETNTISRTGRSCAQNDRP